MSFNEYFKNYNKIRIIRILICLLILAFFPVIISKTPKNNELVTQKALAQGGPANATTSAQTVFWVYGGPLIGDQPAPGWGNNTSYGGGNTVNLTVTNPVYNGVHSISYQVTAASSDKCVLAIMTPTDPPLDITPYTYLSFYAMGTIQGQNYGVSLLDSTGAGMGQTLPMVQYGGPIPIAVPWFVYNIPIAAFGAPTKIIKGIMFSDISGSSQPNVYFDDISFSSVRGELIQAQPPIGPPSTPMPTPTTVPDYYPNISPYVYIIPAVIIFIAVLFQ